RLAARRARDLRDRERPRPARPPEPGARGARDRSRPVRPRPPDGAVRAVRVLILSEHDVHAALDMAACVEAMHEALSALARGEVHNPLRSVVRAPGTATLLG